MKTKKMIGALALTAALAMGTAPAFAAGTEADNAFSDSGSTEVKAKVDTVNKQVRATVPLQVTVVFGATGGGEITGPSAGAYKVTNIGEGDIKLTNIELTGMHSTFTPSVITFDGTDYTDPNSGNTFTSGDHIMFTAQTANNKVYLTDTHAAKDQTTGMLDKNVIESFFGSGTAKRWADEPIAVGENCPITLGGLHYFNSTLDSGEMTDTLCNLKVTIAAA